jgi:hypothetical protein
MGDFLGVREGEPSFCKSLEMTAWVHLRIAVIEEAARLAVEKSETLRR